MRKYTFRVYPKGMSRTVDRVIEMPGDATLDELCHAILNSLEFYDHDHLYEFNMDNKMFGSRFSYQYEPQDYGLSTAVTIDEIGLSKGQNFLLRFDYGDNWGFVIHVNKIEEVYGLVPIRFVRSKGTLEQYPDPECW